MALEQGVEGPAPRLQSDLGAGGAVAARSQVRDRLLLPGDALPRARDGAMATGTGVAVTSHGRAVRLAVT